ncbi:PTS glucose transporter subunit IIA [Amycolatopsis sp. NPDC006131]|uniref:PTS sugar transporter subunit IIA n=1 Tax=Amycolatopsis sp. NPDC006131 TaxID=3156731 RepID=UPI0033A8A859
MVPAAGTLHAPVDAITALSHAFGLRTDDGVEFLIHVGIDTVKLGGRHFTPSVTEGAHVHAGDLLVSIDADAIRADGFDPVTVVLVTSTAGYSEVRTTASAEVREDQILLVLAP